VERVSKIQLGPDLCLEEIKQYEDLLHKYIHLFAFNYKDFREITMDVATLALARDQGKGVARLRAYK
jgi:hypothetical protein